MSSKISLFLAYVEDVQTEIKLRQIRYFLAVAEERNFTRAAERCHVAQPSLSKQIHDIERNLGMKLFDWLPREARLTDVGKLFQKEAVKAIEHARRAASLVRALERQQKQALRIGVSTLCDLPRVQSLISTAQKSAKECSVEVLCDYSAELLLATLRGRLDMAVVDLSVRERGIHFVPMHSESLAAMLPEKHPLVTRPMVRLFELKKKHFILLSARVDSGCASVQDMLRDEGVETTSIHQVSSLIELLDQVAMYRYIA